MRKPTTFMLALVAIAGIAAVTLVSGPDSRSPLLETGTSLAPPRELPEFRLLDHRGEAFTRASLTGRWHLIFPGFTRCPDICPATLATLSQVQQQLGSRAARLTVILLTVDPARDTPETLSRYLAYFSPDFIGMTGEASQLKLLYEGLGIQRIRIPGAGGEYSVDHSAALLLVNPEARLAGYFRPPFKAQALVEDLQRVL